MSEQITAPVAAPPTNAQRAAYICHQGGVRAFGSFFEELLNRITALEKVNVEQAHRISELELVEAARQARRKS